MEASSIQTSLDVLALGNQEEWRSVLASLYEYGRVMGPVLAKHICDALLQKTVEKAFEGSLEKLKA